MSRVDPEITIDHSTTIVGKAKRARRTRTLKSRVYPRSAKVNMLPIIRKAQVKNDLLNAALGLCSIMLVYYESEEFYAVHEETQDGETVVTKQSNESNLKVNLMRGVNIGLTACICKA